MQDYSQLERFGVHYCHPTPHTIIVGTTKLDHLRENVEAVKRGPLSPDVYEEAKRRLDAMGESPAG